MVFVRSNYPDQDLDAMYHEHMQYLNYLLPLQDLLTLSTCHHPCL